MKISNKYEELHLAFQDEATLLQAKKIIDTKNELYQKEYLAVCYNDYDLMQETYRAKNLNLNELLVEFNLNFEGFGVRLFDEFQNITNSVLVNSLNIRYDERPLDSVAFAELKDITILDYTIDKDKESPILLLSSIPQNTPEDDKATLIKVNFSFYDEKHPNY